MATFWRSIDPTAFLSDDLREAIGRRARLLTGLGLLGVTGMVGVALATWSVKDPSLTHATKAAATNLLGYPGAIIADLMMQLTGLASIVLLLPVAIWGWQLASNRPLHREKLRISFWLVALIAIALTLSATRVPAGWPLPTGLGGTLGDALLRLAQFAFGGSLSSTERFIIVGAAGTIAFVAFLISVGLMFRAHGEQDVEAEEEEEDYDDSGVEEDERQRTPLLGLIGHAFLSAKARIGRTFSFLLNRWTNRESASLAPARRGERVEPRWRDAPPVELPAHAAGRLQPAEDYEEEEDEDEEDEAPVRAAPKKAKPVKASKRGDKYELPSLNLLAPPVKEKVSLSSDQLEANATALEGVLVDFGVRGEIINARPGPVVTLYELEPAPGIKSSRVIGLADDIARSMSAVSARVAVVQGRNAIGIELPNAKREKVSFRELLTAEDYTNGPHKLAICLGKTIGGEPVIVDLARMPHLLIAGTTGSGKSVAINTMILSLLYRLKPEQCRLIMIDPKMLELSVYEGIPHLLTPVVTDPKKAVTALKWAVREMEDRYRKMSKIGVRNIDGYNVRVAEAKQKGETLTRSVHTGYDKESGQAIYEEEMLELEPLPLIVVIVDEMADLMMVAGKDIEGAIQRLAQMARAAGIHVVLATQRPSVDVITGTIKANFPTRISFQVTSKIDSRTILGEQGAEQLLGQGDMLYMAGGGRISRVHGPFCSDEEVEKVVRHLKSQGAPQYLEAVTASLEEDEDNPVFDATGMGGGDEGGDLFSQAVQIVVRDQKASTSYIQRRLQIGYNKAASLMERMEKEGVVGQANHAGKREILIGNDNNA
ncbi:DNA translocase FtsK [Variibacter gotjawalensis]|uniref:DNA translocase FtsK n=1 Tax=Variibacter gotjawalensis TaxID=1333996 RepID=A0A0S3PQK4_9BRAD|nr:DNA translocase FtsK 4TM domain-containing protein [Variibacter gotjawalensis]NIK48507.1 S-DNA-T family DNA segregation ATPase FtsK/SpoIIIE [Variibacter gotjawalensis]RZS50372.1 DNA translocase FtsK [Variibacter gotjawalensis]BAT58207.1 DNA translocase FtsK [Variibacter gotjawalensis]